MPKASLARADIAGRCPHIFDPIREPWFGKVWQGDGAAVMCQPCFAETRLAVIAHLMQLQGRTQADAEQFFAEHSLLAEEEEEDEHRPAV